MYYFWGWSLVSHFICKYFLPFLWLVFLYYLCFPLLCKKPLSLIRSHLFIFVFIFITLGGGSKKILLWFLSKSILPMFSSKSFVVSSLTVRSLIHFEFIFVYGVREFSNCTLLHVAVQCCQHHLWKRLSFLHWIFLPSYSEINWPQMHGFISKLSILSHWSIFLFWCQYHTVCWL